jgi:Na+-driven multidrug efflux pump
VLELPLAWLLAYHVGWGPTGVFTAVSAAFVSLAAISIVLFNQGHWKTKRV